MVFVGVEISNDWLAFLWLFWGWDGLNFFGFAMVVMAVVFLVVAAEIGNSFFLAEFFWLKAFILF